MTMYQFMVNAFYKLCNALHCELRDIIADQETIELLEEYGKNK